MTCYVDNMKANYKNMVMCHLIADTDEELLSMALKLGLKESYWQKKGTRHSHFDISLSKRKLAIKFGAIPISTRELAQITLRRKNAKT